MTNPKQNRRARKKGLKKASRKKRMVSIKNSSTEDLAHNKTGNKYIFGGKQKFMRGVMASSDGSNQRAKNKKQCNR